MQTTAKIRFAPKSTNASPMSGTKASSKAIASLQVNPRLSLEDQVAQRAHEIGEQRGAGWGSELSDWFQAAAEVYRRHEQLLRVAPTSRGDMHDRTRDHEVHAHHAFICSR